MSPAILDDILITRGLWWPGLEITCYADEDAQQVAEIEGWTPQLQVRGAPGLPVICELPATLAVDEQAAIVTVAPVEEATTATLPAGKYQTDLCFLNDQGKPVGPYARARVLISDTNTIPEA